MFVAVNTMGQVLYTIEPSNEQDFAGITEIGDGTFLYKLDDSDALEISKVYFDFDTGRLLKIPEKPSEHHVFDYSKKEWVDPRTSETEWELRRFERDIKLRASDWTQLPDVPLATKEAWAAYRQALRDVTNQPDPFNIVWPTPPN